MARITRLPMAPALGELYFFGAGAKEFFHVRLIALKD
jgi:hypothetical protein